MAQEYLTEEEQQSVKAAIALAEKSSSGEIRVHIERKCKENVMDRAAFIFEQLAMHRTKLRNGVLFYLALDDHKLAILGDVGINQLVPEGFWDQCKEHLIKKIKRGEMIKGLCEAIVLAGNQLKEHFPYQSDDLNELSDEISFS